MMATNLNDRDRPPDPNILLSVVNHVVLPPKLPGKQDHGDVVDAELMRRLIDAVRTVRDHASSDNFAGLENTLSTLKATRMINVEGDINRTALHDRLVDLPPDISLILHVPSQNAGILIYRQESDENGSEVVFELFEASPKSKAVLAAKLALSWEFPGPIVAVPSPCLDDTPFITALTQFLGRASSESIPSFASSTKKAGRRIAENRDTTDPALITGFLATVLEALGRRIARPRFRKRIRDDVSWAEGSELPWRRSPLWLVLRVALQSHLQRTYGTRPGRLLYKLIGAVFVRDLLVDATKALGSDLVTLLRAKLGRRLAKLQLRRDLTFNAATDAFDKIVLSLNVAFEKSLQSATKCIENDWSAFKNSTQRKVRPLPQKVQIEDVTLALPNSSPYVYSVLQWNAKLDNAARRFGNLQIPSGYHGYASRSTKMGIFCNTYYELAVLEETLAGQYFQTTAPTSVEQVAADITNYISRVGTLYDSDPDQTSLMILTVMSMWCSLDQLAVNEYPLLKSFHPGVRSTAFHILHLTRLSELKCLQRIEEYLKEREDACHQSCITIFDDPSASSFAVRYFDSSTESHNLKRKLKELETAADACKDCKVKEYESLCMKVRDLDTKISTSSCVRSTTNDDDEHIRRCTHCFLKRQRRRVKITVFEYPLPTSLPHRKALVFELNPPKGFTTYRDTTWTVLRFLEGLKGRAENVQAHRISSVELLSPHDLSRGHVILASSTKPFGKTHYRQLNFPQSLNAVCLPCGFQLHYYDKGGKTWASWKVSDLKFAQHLRIIHSLRKFLKPFGDIENKMGTSQLSSSQVIANHTLCESGLNPHEFIAIGQCLAVGDNMRWINLLVELGSSNLNFSSEPARVLVNTICSRVGHPHHSGHFLRESLQIAQDESFCARLDEMIHLRLQDIAANWRESNSMDVLIILSLRMNDWASELDALYDSKKTIRALRDVIYGWLTSLSSEVRETTDTENTQRLNRYIFEAALLYRKTFSNWDIPSQHPCCSIISDDISGWIEVSIILRDALPQDPGTLPQILKHALIRDAKLALHLRNLIWDHLIAHHQTFKAAVSRILGLEDCNLLSDTVPIPNSWWIQSVSSASQSTRKQIYKYNVVEGIFLVDDQEIGQLPPDHKDSAVIRELFGEQTLRTVPSCLLGMTHMVVSPRYGPQIHFGFRGVELFIRAFHTGPKQRLEFVPSRIFSIPTGRTDLPLPLIIDVAHWLDLDTGKVEVRMRPNIWRSKATNWNIDYQQTRKATREARSMQTLVETTSRLFVQVASIFANFEDIDQLVVTESQKNLQNRQPQLRIDLRRLELTFTVNRNGWLQSPELRAEIDPDQNIGTWHGLKSMIALRDPVDHSCRSVIIPLGDQIKCQRTGPHISVTVKNTGLYGQYTVNQTLGRLECAAEPKLLLTKAMFHAFTSSNVSDSLTGRTGTEEALHCLESGSASPWMPLNIGPIKILRLISRLIPLRSYYPEGMQVMEKTKWDDSLSQNIQHDGFLPALSAILHTNDSLSRLTPNTVEAQPLPDTHPHLSERALQRRSITERPWDAKYTRVAADDCYQPRHDCGHSTSRSNTYEVTKSLIVRPAKLSKTSPVYNVIQKWNEIEGFSKTFPLTCLSAVLDAKMDDIWGPLVRLCVDSDPERDKFALVFTLALLAFQKDVSMDLVRSLVAFAIYPEFKQIQLPEVATFLNFKPAERLSIDKIVDLAKPHTIAYQTPESAAFGNLNSLKERRRLQIAQDQHEQNVKTQCTRLAKHLIQLWPCEDPSISTDLALDLVNIPEAIDALRPEWARLYQNWQLSELIKTIELRLRHRQGEHCAFVLEPHSPNPHHKNVEAIDGGLPRLSELLSKVSCDDIANVYVYDYEPIISKPDQIPSKAGCDTNFELPSHVGEVPAKNSQELQELRSILAEFETSGSKVRQNYVSDLTRSIEAQCQIKHDRTTDGRTHRNHVITPNVRNSEAYLNKMFYSVAEALGKSDKRHHWLHLSGLWPVVTPVSLLEKIRSFNFSKIPLHIRKLLVEYGVAVTKHQRLLRMRAHITLGDDRMLLHEMSNTGHTNWDPHEHTDWLLFEIDSNVTIRPKQCDVAAAMISPPSQRNSVLQMNMGEGKTSCVMVLCASTLANTHQLARIVIPKALLQQTAQLLQSRLGGLLGRSVMHIPWSRKTQTCVENVTTYRDLHLTNKAHGGIILSLPEHQMSFCLSGQQRLLDGRHEEARLMMEMQNWLETNCRDVLDESDHTLAVRTQLIYPSGTQTIVDGAPYRWEISEQLLQLAASHLPSLHLAYPNSLDLMAIGGFTVTHFLRKDVEDALVERLLGDIIENRVSGMPTLAFTQYGEKLIRDYVAEPIISNATTEEVHAMFASQPGMMQRLHLMRGLLAYRILISTLKKRWNVEYGLHPDRNPMAVPYHAKGVPAEQAEWGHPDVAILLTCLSFYHGGLDLNDLKQSLDHIAKSDDPRGEFERWSQFAPSLQASHRDWSAINVEDMAQMHEIWDKVRFDTSVVDYFMNRFVFPRHAKQFTTKLQSSGWDLPLPQNKHTSHIGKNDCTSCTLTTGFSGTNDNKALLPLNIEQQDLHSLAHTNSEVLTYLLEPRNRKTILALDKRQARLSEKGLLRELFSQSSDILIDAGALILEMNNLEVASAWLDVNYLAPAALYFDANDKPMVLNRHGTKKPLIATPFAKDLTNVLVYLDQSHTRGTDLKFPSDAKGVVTLGLGQTKDATVQAAMRLRQLGTTQSVVFLAPLEVYQSVIDLVGKPLKSTIDSHDIIHWLLEQTCAGMEQLQPLYYAQGKDYCQRRQAALEHPSPWESNRQAKPYLAKLRRDELQTLEKMYKPMMSDDAAVLAEGASPEIANIIGQLESLRVGLGSSELTAAASIMQEVEQEREISLEVESVREVQKPVHFEALAFGGLHSDIKRYLESGIVDRLPQGYKPAMDSVASTDIGQKRHARKYIGTLRLFVSAEFDRTVKLLQGEANDNFFRPVQWILFSHRSESAITITPEEAGLVLPMLRAGVSSSVHLVLYSAPVTTRMLHFSDLNYYAIPPMRAGWKAPKWLAIELGFLAGRLCFKFDEYDQLRQRLGLKAADGSLPQDPGSTAADPLAFVQEWLSIRRRGQDFAHTPMGMVCQGRELMATHPIFDVPKAPPSTGTSASATS